MLHNGSSRLGYHILLLLCFLTSLISSWPKKLHLRGQKAKITFNNYELEDKTCLTQLSSIGPNLGI